MARWLVLPVAMLLFAQWPQREWVGGWSRETNDLGQWLFALYAAVAVTAATCSGAHLRVETFGAGGEGGTRRRSGAAVLVAGPLTWAAFVLWSGGGTIWASLRGLEQFPDTSDPGYFMVKVGLALCMVLILAEGACRLFAPAPAGTLR